MDVADEALELARRNLERASKSHSLVPKGRISFLKADVLRDPFVEPRSGLPPLTSALHSHRLPPSWDILISNPPYISPSGYWKTTTRSVRGFEPTLALVPPMHPGLSDMQRGDAFYGPLLRIARDTEVKIVLLEIADIDQALRVARTAREMGIFDGIEIWNSQPDLGQEATTSSGEYPIIGQGTARSVLCWRGAGTQWLKRTTPDRQPDDNAAAAP